MSQRQLRGTARARGEEVGGELQHRTQVKPREAGLMEASVRKRDAQYSTVVRTVWGTGAAGH